MEEGDGHGGNRHKGNRGSEPHHPSKSDGTTEPSGWHRTDQAFPPPVLPSHPQPPIRTALLDCQLSCHVRGTGEGGHSLVRRKGNGALGRGEKRSRRGGEIPTPLQEIVWWGKDRPRWRPSENTPRERNGWMGKDGSKPCHTVGPASPTGRNG